MNSIPDILNRIVERRRITLSQEQASIRTWLDQRAGSTDEPVPSGRAFLDSISDCTGPAIIAEIKLGSPKLGDLRAQIDSTSLARTYQEAGAVAISVVTEPDFFHGSYDLLTQCRETAGLPALCKDFVVDPIQIALA